MNGACWFICRLIHRLMLSQFSYTVQELSRSSTTHNMLGPSASINNKGNLQQICPQINMGQALTQLWLSSQIKVILEKVKVKSFEVSFVRCELWGKVEISFCFSEQTLVQCYKPEQRLMAVKIIGSRNIISRLWRPQALGKTLQCFGKLLHYQIVF